MSILSGAEIARQVKLGRIEIDPYTKDHLNPASIDLTLGKDVVVYLFSGPELDVKKPAETERFTIDRERGYRLEPGMLYLMHTTERVKTEEFVPILDGKSSIGRLGIVVHLTAGYGDPGFDGQYTLEVTVVHPIRVYPGMRFCQMRFHNLLGERVNYQHGGNYTGSDATGPVPSKSYKQFE